jgi:ArsR family transcriptional regulator, virulence genes transcriptional regulator
LAQHLAADALGKNAAMVAGLLRVLANERRLIILCALTQNKEMNVTALAAAAGSSQSALSQHLAQMRVARIVSYRREGQTLWYRIADPRIATLMARLESLFCDARPGRTRKR